MNPRPPFPPAPVPDPGPTPPHPEPGEPDPLPPDPEDRRHDPGPGYKCLRCGDEFGSAEDLAGHPCKARKPQLGAPPGPGRQGDVRGGKRQDNPGRDGPPPGSGAPLTTSGRQLQ